MVEYNGATTMDYSTMRPVGDMGRNEFEQLYGSGVSEAAALRPWHTALANRDNAPATVVCIGDSIVEGIGAGTHNGKWFLGVQRLLRARFPLITSVVGGPGYYPAYHSTDVPDAGVWTTSGNPSKLTDFGLGRRELKLTTTGQTATATFTGTDAILMWGKGDNIASSFSYTVDGGAPQSVSWTAAIASGQTINITGLSAGAHTIVISWVSGVVYINGVWVFNGDYGKGIHVLDSGHAGYGVPSFDINTFWLADVKAVNPSLITIALGVNDQRLLGLSAATYQTNLTTFISRIKAQLINPCSIVLIADYQATGSFPDSWDKYVKAMQTIADNDPTISFLDLTLRMEPAVTANINGLYLADLIHPSVAGHSFIAQIVANFISPK